MKIWHVTNVDESDDSTHNSNTFKKYLNNLPAFRKLKSAWEKNAHFHFSHLMLKLSCPICLLFRSILTGEAYLQGQAIAKQPKLFDLQVALSAIIKSISPVKLEMKYSVQTALCNLDKAAFALMVWTFCKSAMAVVGSGPKL